VEYLHGFCPAIADLADLPSLAHEVEAQVQVQHVVKQQDGDPPAMQLELSIL